MMDDQTARRIYKVRTRRVLRMHLPVGTYIELHAQAALRGWSIEILAAEMLAKIAQDKLTNAVLDDEARPTAHPASADRSPSATVTRR